MKFNPNQLDALRVTVMHVLKRHRSPFTANLGQRLNQTNDMQLTIPVVKIGPSEALYAEAIRGTTHGTEDRIAAVKQFRKAQREEAQRILPKLKACGLTAWIDTSFEIMVRPARSSEVRKRAACIGDTSK